MTGSCGSVCHSSSPCPPSVCACSTPTWNIRRWPCIVQSLWSTSTCESVTSDSHGAKEPRACSMWVKVNCHLFHETNHINSRTQLSTLCPMAMRPMSTATHCIKSTAVSDSKSKLIRVTFKTIQIQLSNILKLLLMMWENLFVEILIK